jgi:hypothetical protein
MYKENIFRMFFAFPVPLCESFLLLKIIRIDFTVFQVGVPESSLFYPGIFVRGRRGMRRTRKLRNLLGFGRFEYKKSLAFFAIWGYNKKPI